MGTDEFCREVESLPAEDSTVDAECVIRSLQTIMSDIDQQRAGLASQRWQEIASGRVTPIGSDEAFQAIWSRVA